MNLLFVSPGLVALGTERILRFSTKGSQRALIPAQEIKKEIIIIIIIVKATRTKGKGNGDGCGCDGGVGGGTSKGWEERSVGFLSPRRG